MFDFIKNAAFKRLAVTGVRHGLTALGMYLVSKGYTTEQDWSSIALDLSPIVVAMVWSVLEKQTSDKKLDTALDMPAGTTHAELDAVIKAEKKD